MTKDIFSKLFRWQPSWSTLIAATTGVIVIALSAAMIPAKDIPWLSIFLRDIAMVILAGILFPLMYIFRTENDFTDFGLSFKKWYIYLPINLVLGTLLFFMFLSENPLPTDFRLSAPVFWRAVYIMLTGVFEVVFFYSFQRTLFERAFGIVPAIVLTAIFYAFHHVGFQPEFGKLIFVGLMYATIFRLGNSALLIYPFFWGVGACYDVLVQSQVVSEIAYPEVRALLLVTLIPVAVIAARTITSHKAI
ncbi:MAG: hypothetical protein AB1531_02500 [Chloroflexota bacterium]